MTLFKAVFTLVAGNVIAKVIGIASIPIITRVYTPDQMGVLNTFISVVAILAPLGTLRYVTALPVPRTAGVAANLFVLNISVLIIATSTLSVLALLVGQEFLKLLSFSALNPFLSFIVAGVFLTGFYETLSLWATRYRAYSTLARSLASQALLGNAVKIVMGVIGFKSSGLVCGQLAQQAGGLLPLVKISFLEIRRLKRSIRFSRVIKIGYLFSDMPRYRLPSHMLLMGAMQGPVLFTAYLYGMSEAGQLGLALTALALPVSILGGAAGNAYFAEISALGKGKSKQILQMTRALTKKLFWMSLLPAITLMAGGPWIFLLVFGADWSLAGEYARVLSIYLIFQFISAPLGNVLTLYRRQDLFFKMNLFRFLMVILVFGGSNFIGLDGVTTVLIYALCMSVHYFSTNRIIMSLIKRHAAEARSL